MWEISTLSGARCDGGPISKLRGFSAKLLEREALHKQGSLVARDDDRLMSAQTVEEINGHCRLVSVPFHLPALLSSVSVLCRQALL